MAAHVLTLEDIRIGWDRCKENALGTSIPLHDSEVIYSAVRFATDTILYLEIPGTLSPHIFADPFFERLLDGWILRP